MLLLVGLSSITCTNYTNAQEEIVIWVLGYLYLEQALTKAYSPHDFCEWGFLTKRNLMLQKWLSLPCFNME